MAVALRVFIDHLPERAWEADRREESFAELYGRCRLELVALCRRHLGPEGDAEAVAQEAFLKAWSSLDRYSSARPFWPWVATIARRLCIDQLRRRQREQRHVYREVHWRGDYPDEPEVHIEDMEEHRAAICAFKRLRPREQLLLGLREVDGWSLDQLARFEGISLEAARTALKRARAALRQSYEQVTSGVSAAILGIGVIQRLRAKIGRAGTKTSSVNPAFAARAGELIVAVLVVAAGNGGAAAPGNQIQPSAAPASSSAGSAATAPPAADRPAAPHHASEPSAGPTAAAGADSAPAPVATNQSSTADPRPLPIPLDRVETPEDAAVSSFTASPSYEKDGTIYASGKAAAGCALEPCSVLFRSTDRGSSWTRLAADGFAGGRILLPPSYPADSRLFASGLFGLQVSDDGGASFRPVPLTPTGGEATMSPGFSSGDPRIMVGSMPSWVYDDRDGVARPGPLTPSASEAVVPQFAPDVVDGSLLLVGGTTVTPTGDRVSAVFRCDVAKCSVLSLLPGSKTEPSLRLSPTFGTSGEMWAWHAEGLFRSTTGGNSVERIVLPQNRSVTDFAFGRGHDRFVASSGDGGRLLRSRDAGTTWTQVKDTGVEAVAVLPDGRLITGNRGRGISCSSDGGTTWEPRC